MKRKPKSAGYGHNQLASIKLLAHEIKKTTGFKHCIALNMASRRFGFKSYNQARTAASSTGPLPGFPRAICVDRARDFPTYTLKQLATTLNVIVAHNQNNRMTGGRIEKTLESISAAINHSNAPGLRWKNHYYSMTAKKQP